MKRRIFVAGIITAVLVIILCIRALICNSDWYINNKLSKMNITNELLKNKVSYSYRQEYGKEKIKIFIAIDNLDTTIINLYKNYSPEKEIFKFEFMDKDDYKISDCVFVFDDITCGENGYCRGSKIIKMKKQDAKEIKKIEPLYNTAILLRYDEIQKRINNAFNW